MCLSAVNKQTLLLLGTRRMYGCWWLELNSVKSFKFMSNLESSNLNAAARNMSRQRQRGKRSSREVHSIGLITSDKVGSRLVSMKCPASLRSCHRSSSSWIFRIPNSDSRTDFGLLIILKLVIWWAWMGLWLVHIQQEALTMVCMTIVRYIAFTSKGTYIDNYT